MRDIENFRLVDGAKIDNLPNNTVTELNGKQATLVSGTNIKTVNGQSILGSGDLNVTPADGSITEAKLSTSVNTSLDKADSALQSTDIGTTVQGYSSVLAGTTASFTAAKDTKLSGIEAGAQVNTINDVIAGANIVIDKTDPRNPIFSSTGGGGGGISDGDKGDITVSSFGTVWTIDNQAVTRSKMEHIQTGHFLGRHATGTGDVQEVSPAQARTILDIDNLLASKADITGETFTGKINLPPSTTSNAPLNLGDGVAPTAPLGGDIWISSDRLQFREHSTGQIRALGASGNLTGVSQVIAEAGTETANRMWSALRVRQAITGWWATISSTIAMKTGGNTFSGEQIITGNLISQNGFFAQGVGSGTAGSNACAIKSQNTSSGAIWSGRTDNNNDYIFEYFNGATWANRVKFYSDGNFEVNGQNWTSAWTSYTPAVTAGSSTGISTVWARYKQIGKTCVGGFQINIVSPDTSISEVIISLPVTGPYYQSAIAVSLFDNGSWTPAFANIDGTSISFVKIGGNFTGFLVIRGSFTYETN